jgi:hypothetical protein
MPSHGIKGQRNSKPIKIKTLREKISSTMRLSNRATQERGRMSQGSFTLLSRVGFP